jgi:coenzyme F420-reducing hydrogenase alpha subunit
LPALETALGSALASVDFIAQLPYPDFERDYEFVALRHPDEYPFNEGRIVSSQGIDIAAADFETVFTEEHVARSTALQARVLQRDDYFCGPLARMNLNFDRLGETARQAATTAGFVPPVKNPYKSMIARMVEIVQALDEAISIIRGYTPPEAPAVPVLPRAGTGYACTEAPRGILWHKYTIDAEGIVTDARIVPPTSQNQRCIEKDLWQLAPALPAMPHDAATRRAEQAVRNYDPCISCSTHFLKLTIERD